ncbi:hypothetical protein Plhal703r1_c13g0066601 [Plasmopara halstedii]
MHKSIVYLVMLMNVLHWLIMEGENQSFVLLPTNQEDEAVPKSIGCCLIVVED